MIWLAASLALLTSAGLSALIAWCGPVDRPRERGMHDAPTPTAGGLAMTGGAAAGVVLLIAFTPTTPTLGHTLAATLGLAVLAGLFGAADDVIDLPARTKLLAQIALAAAFALLVPPPIRIPLLDGFDLVLPEAIMRLGVAAFILLAMNAVNFMDGANGLVAGSMAIVLAGFGASLLAHDLQSLAALYLCGAAAALGFLPFNFPRARLFQGDAGALFLGALAATTFLLAVHQGPTLRGLSLFSLPIALLPLLTDVLLTLVLRARRREQLFEAHKEHLYQRWLAAHGGDHAALARRFWPIVAAFTLAGLAVADASPTLATLTFLGATTVAVMGWLWVDRRMKSRSGSVT